MVLGPVGHTAAGRCDSPFPLPLRQGYTTFEFRTDAGRNRFPSTMWLLHFSH